MTSAFYYQTLIASGVAYLLGSIPFGLLLTTAAGLGDVRSIGSGNIGATNVLRTGNKKLAAATLLLDGLKGTAAVWLVGAVIGPWLLSKGFGADGPGALTSRSPANPGLAAMLERLRALEMMVMASGIAAFIGHIYPVWLGFKGGKGVATYIGVLIGIVWQVALAFCGVWMLMAFAFRYSSLAALVAATVTPAVAYWMTGSPLLTWCLILMTALLFWTHRENIRRLLNGTESKIGAKAAKPVESAS